MQTFLSCIPVAVLVIALVGLKLPAWKAALAAFAVCAVEAFALRGVGLGEIATCSLKGASTGLFPIGLIIVAALFTYAVVVESGAEDEIKSGLSSLSGDKRYLALLIAWGFGNFMEGMAGFGTAVAIPCAIKAAGGKKILYREYKGLGHNVWTPTFSDDKVFEWLFSQRRSGK